MQPLRKIFMTTAQAREDLLDTAEMSYFLTHQDIFELALRNERRLIDSERNGDLLLREGRGAQTVLPWAALTPRDRGDRYVRQAFDIDSRCDRILADIMEKRGIFDHGAALDRALFRQFYLTNENRNGYTVYNRIRLQADDRAAIVLDLPFTVTL